MSSDPMIVLCDTREPWPHPWSAMLPEGWAFERTSLETGDFALAFHPHGAVVERKTPGDLASCIGTGRERFERELRRSRYVGRFVVLIEGSLSDVAIAARGVHHNAVLGSIASWTLRFCPFVFAGSQRLAADFAFRFLASQLPSEERRAQAALALKARRAIRPAPNELIRPAPNEQRATHILHNHIEV
jgi:DNA excision repair protein ERCC-4